MGTIEALTFLADPRTAYTSNSISRAIVVRLASHSFVDLGQSLASFLQFIDRQCTELAADSETSAYDEQMFKLRDDAWTRICLYCNGLAFDFRSIDTALARDVLNWHQDPLDSARMELEGFKLLVERQLYKDVFVDGNPQENIARALLQAYLRSRSYREVPVRGGRTDILVFSKNGRFLYEMKIWRGADYHEQGLRELEEYIMGEGDDGGMSGVFYVVFDPTRSARAEQYLGGYVTTRTIHKHDVTIIVVNLNPPKPSRTL